MTEEVHSLKLTRERYAKLPLVYACSGCSSAAQLTNQLALRLDHLEMAEMSCAVGVGAGVKPLANLARKGRALLALDGCPLHCVRHSLFRAGVEPHVHVDLSRHGVRKDLHRLPSEQEFAVVWTQVLLPAYSRLPCQGSSEANDSHLLTKAMS